MGYQELGTESVGNKMVVPTFLNVSESNKVSLSDLKVTGYTAPTWDSKSKKYIGGCVGGKFLMNKVDESGLAIPGCKYYWIDNGTVGPGWFADTIGTAIEEGADSVKIPAGLGLWTFGSGYRVTFPAAEF